MGRYNEETYPKFQDRNKDDIEWCKEYRLDYVPVVYPGFSWQNMRPGNPFDAIPRNKGNFLWKQFAGAIEAGAKMIYVAMMRLMKETAIFKCAKEVPGGASRFVAIEKEVPVDHFCSLAPLKLKLPRG